MSPDVAEHRLAAILHADVVGYCRLMAQNEAATIRALHADLEDIERLVREHHGRLVDSTGDSVLAEFPTATSAVGAALGIQSAASSKNAELEPDRRMLFRIGIHLGELRAEGGRIYGDAVNVAARIQAMAEAGGVCLSSVVYEQVRNKLPLCYEDLGGRQIKNIPYPVHVYRVGTTAGPNPLGHENDGQQPAADIGGAGHEGKPHRRGSIAVLPFDIFTPDPNGVAYGDILATEIIQSLSRPHGLRVASRLASAAYRGRAVDPRIIGYELGVDYVLGGNLRRSGERAKVVVEITDTRSGSQLWTRTWIVPVSQLLDVPEPIAEAIVAAFEGEYVRAEVRRARTIPDEDLDARGLLHKARTWFLRYSEAGLLEALELTHRAVDLEPTYAVAHATRALVTIELSLNAWGGEPERMEHEARTAADLAVELAPDHPICLENHGLVWFHCGEYERSVRALRRAVEIAPTDLPAWAHLGFALGWGGAEDADVEESDAILQRIHETAPEHPLSGFWPFFRSSALVRLGRHPEAIEACRRGAESYPGFVFMWLALANALALDGQVAPADDALARAREANEAVTAARYADLVRRQARGLGAVEVNLAGLRKLAAL